jgi:hypothetical protein
VARKKREVEIDIATPLGLRSGERSTFIRWHAAVISPLSAKR